MSNYSQIKQVTIPWVLQQKSIKKLTMLTAYDYPTAFLLDQAGIDLLLVGDSLASVVYGEPNTLSITMDDMLRHTRAVAKAAKRALVIGDLPFLSYHVSQEQAIENSGRFLKEAQAQAVKLEGGLERAKTISAITDAQIPVVAHIGLTPQSIHKLGAHRIHGKSLVEKQYLIESAHAVAEAGAFLIVLECVQPDLATEITEAVSVPTIGIGSGKNCDGQVLVTHDLVGLTIGHVPKFVTPQANVGHQILESAQKFIQQTSQQNVNENSINSEGDTFAS